MEHSEQWLKNFYNLMNRVYILRSDLEQIKNVSKQMTEEELMLVFNSIKMRNRKLIKKLIWIDVPARKENI
jgi:hypothetical protein